MRYNISCIFSVTNISLAKNYRIFHFFRTSVIINNNNEHHVSFLRKKTFLSRAFELRSLERMSWVKLASSSSSRAKSSTDGGVCDTPCSFLLVQIDEILYFIIIYRVRVFSNYCVWCGIISCKRIYVYPKRTSSKIQEIQHIYNLTKRHKNLLTWVIFSYFIEIISMYTLLSVF